MQLSAIQLAAILQAGKHMIMADGKVDPAEVRVLTVELLHFNVAPDHVKSLLELGDAMETPVMLATLAGLDNETKKYVAGYLATIMVADGDIDENEMKLWQLTCTLAGFPTMTLNDALQYWRNH